MESKHLHSASPRRFFYQPHMGIVEYTYLSEMRLCSSVTANKDMMRSGDLLSLISIRGFTLIELVVATMVIGILAIVAAPNFLFYRDKGRVASGVSTANAIQAALASYATTSANNLYPAAIADYSELVTIANANGTTLKGTAQAMGIQLQTYSVIDSDGNGEPNSYTMNLRVLGVAT